MEQNEAIEQALNALRSGRMIVIIDDADRENEGDVVMAAEHITEQAMAFFIRHTSGIVCLALANDIADRLDLPPMVARNTSRYGTAFTISIEGIDVGSGVSAADRTRTILAAVRDGAKPHDLRRPGHVFPLRADKNGVLGRPGHTEASVDLCRLAGLKPAAVIAELMHDDGMMMRDESLRAFAAEHELPIVSVADIITLRHT
jgi:3,4-dihydroxy-2-butanone 4-phosphate synthase